MKVDNEEYEYIRNVNGQIFKHTLKLIARFNESLTECPVCGSYECCGATDKFIWAEFDGEKTAIYFEDGEFEAYLNCWENTGISLEEYHLLPDFIKEFNEEKGWNGWDRTNPNSIIDALDLKKAMAFIKNSKNIVENDKFHTLFYPVIMEFVDRVINENKILNILKQ